MKIKLFGDILNRMWDFIIKPIISELKIKKIIEIGSDTGLNTKNILEYCKENNAELISIDPFPKFDVDEYLKKYQGHFKLYKELSLERLPKLSNYDCILIDGDHNWYTVFNELKNVELTNSVFPIVFLHDISWPYARRDLYYNPDTIPKEFRKTYKKLGIDIEQDFLEYGAFNNELYHSIESNTKNNGVLTAIEDFISQTKLNLEFETIPIFFGLGVLFENDSLNNRKKIIKKYVNDNKKLIQFAEKYYLNEIGQIDKNKNNAIDFFKDQIDKKNAAMDYFKDQIEHKNKRIKYLESQVEQKNKRIKYLESQVEQKN